MTLTKKDIFLDDQPELRAVCAPVQMPLSAEDIEIATALREYVINSVDEEKALELDLAPSVGIAAPQIGILKRMCVVHYNFDEEMEDVDLVLINPSIINHAKEYIYLEGGEACLSVAEKKEGYVPRYAWIKIRFTDLLGRTKTMTAHGFEAIVIQHEMDHLDGILFYDHIDQEDPFKIPNNATVL